MKLNPRRAWSKSAPQNKSSFHSEEIAVAVSGFNPIENSVFDFFRCKRIYSEQSEDLILRCSAAGFHLIGEIYERE